MPRPSDRAILDYAKPVAEAFLDAIKTGRLEPTADLLTKDYERRLRDRRPNSTIDQALRDAVVFTMVRVYNSDQAVVEQMARWEVRSTQLSPDRKEVASEGAFVMKDGKEFKFRLLVREDTEGKWRVDAMVLTP